MTDMDQTGLSNCPTFLTLAQITHAQRLWGEAEGEHHFVQVHFPSLVRN
jgi:hypothetical protein